jgi:hypothetical protein
VSEKSRAALTAQARFDFGRTSARLAECPRRGNAGVNHGVTQRAIVMDDGLPTQPIEQPVAVACPEHVVERVLATRLSHGGQRACEEVEVVIAEHGDATLAERAHEAQHPQ